MSKSYQELRERMDQWGVLPGSASGHEAFERLKALEALVRDMLDVALSEKKS